MACHLQPSVAIPGLRRFGKGDFSFRAGDPLSDHFVQVDVEEEGRAASERFEINHHPYRLQQSRCRTASGAAFSCLTCHDPHQRVPETERAAHYRAACLTCHQDSPETHAAGQNDCVSCHMPKRRTQDVVRVVMTDHWIRRQPGGPELLAPLFDQFVVVVIHPYTPCFRLALMKSSRSPSSTVCVAPFSTPVRRSLMRDWSRT